MSQSEVHARNFLMHRGALMDLYAQLPDDQGTFSAWEGGMTFIVQADYLSGSSERFMGMISGEVPAGPPTPVTPSADLQAARERLATTTEHAAAVMRSLSDEDLHRRITAFGGREMPIAALLDALIGHEAHHKGQVWVMARMVGIKPPMFVKMG